MMYVSCQRSFLALSLPGSPVRHWRKEGRSVLQRERARDRETHRERNFSLFWRLFGCQMALFGICFMASLRFTEVCCTTERPEHDCSLTVFLFWRLNFRSASLNFLFELLLLFWIYDYTAVLNLFKSRPSIVYNNVHIPHDPLFQ